MLECKVRKADDRIRRRSDLVAHIAEIHSWPLGQLLRRSNPPPQVLPVPLGKRVLLTLRASIAPRANDFDWIALLIVDQVLLVAHPTVRAVFFSEAILGEVLASGKDVHLLLFISGDIL